jgi:hypothetical protein
VKGYVLPEPDEKDAYWCVHCGAVMMTTLQAERHEHYFERPEMPEPEARLMDALIDEGLLRKPDQRERETWDYNVEAVKRIAEAIS